MGIKLLEWQKRVVRDWLAVDDGGQFVHRRCGLSVPRQSGKSFVTIAVVNYLVLVLHMRVAFTAHNYSTVGDIFDRFKRLYGYRANDPNAANKELNALVKNVRGATSRECIELHSVDVDGKTLDPCAAFSTRTDSSLRGQSFDVLVCDESQELTPAQLSSILPITNSGPCSNPMTIYLGTPETPASRGDVFGHVREDAICGKSDDICWAEWSVDSVGDVRDVSRWYETNPSLGILSNESSLRAAVGSMNEFDFAQEYMGYWRSQSVNAVIDASSWDACKTATPPDGGAVTYSVKCSPDDAEMVVAACARGDGFAHFEVVMEQPTSMGVGKVAEWLAERSGDAAQIVVDGQGVAQTLTDRLKAMGVPQRVVIRPKPRDVANACATLLDAINEKSCTHFGQQALDEAAKVCSRRNIGTSGGWGFAGSGAMLLEAVALAHWGAVNTKRNPNRKQRVL